MATWLDERKETPFLGCLIILNIGEEQVASLTSSYREELKNKIADCHADGFLVLYAFDIENGPSRLPDGWDNMEGVDFIRMTFGVCGRRDVNFKLDPEERRKELVEIVNNVHQHFAFAGPAFITGRCQIDSSPVVMPLVEVK